MKILPNEVIKAVTQPKGSLRDLLLGAVITPEAIVLKAIESDPAIEQVACSSALDIFLVSLDLNHVFKIDANFLYVLQDTEDFNFLMIPESEIEQVSHLINFIVAYGVGSVVEVHNVLGKKRYTVEDVRKNLSEVNRFSGYIKHFRYETNNYPLPIINDYPFTSNVVYRQGYYVLELPSKSLNLSDHLAYYKNVYSKDLQPVSLDSAGLYEYRSEDFEFITRLVLAYNFNCKRIAEVFNLPYEAFKGYLVTKYRYKSNHVGVYQYNSKKHDTTLASTYSNSNFFYDPYNVINVA